MIRALVIIVVTGFVMSVVCISAAVAIGGPDAIARSAWNWDWNWDGDGHDHHHFRMWRHLPAVSGPQSQRDFPWSGTSLEVNAPAEVDYVQAQGPAKLTVSGPAAALAQVRVENGRITLAQGLPHWGGLRITLSAPAVTRFDLHGADQLRITGYNQDQLAVSVTGHADVSAQGQTKAVRLSISGAGAADLAQLKTAGADIDISGAGETTVGPTDWARVQIAGVGDVNLLTRPPRLETHIAGAGQVRQPGQDSATGSVPDDDDARGPARPT